MIKITRNQYLLTSKNPHFIGNRPINEIYLHRIRQLQGIEPRGSDICPYKEMKCTCEDYNCKYYRIKKKECMLEYKKNSEVKTIMNDKKKGRPELFKERVWYNLIIPKSLKGDKEFYKYMRKCRDNYIKGEPIFLKELYDIMVNTMKPIKQLSKEEANILNIIEVSIFE